MLASELRKLIGLELNFRGSLWVVHEIVDAGLPQAQLVLRTANTQAERVIQGDQWGDAHRRVPDTITLPAYNDDGSASVELETLAAELGLST